jgi:methylenetetrahydrofolate reductase (NADPH)
MRLLNDERQRKVPCGSITGPPVFSPNTMACTVRTTLAEPTRAVRVTTTIAQLLREASIEIHAHDTGALTHSRHLLAPGTRHYVSHLPRQSWDATIAACRAVNAAGFTPIPHLPVRRLRSRAELDEVLQQLVQEAGVREVFVIAGDYATAVGPFYATADVLDAGYLEKHGCTGISLAGHPEGHPVVAADRMRQAEIDKANSAARRGLDATVLAQFLFDAQPFLRWSRERRTQGVRARLVCGLTGPASTTTLWRFAVRCGVGPSLRALGAYPAAVPRLLREHDPRPMIRTLAEAKLDNLGDVSGIHVFVFGGYLRTVRWLAGLASTPLQLTHDGGFRSWS